MESKIKLLALYFLLSLSFCCDKADDDEIIPEAEKATNVYALISEYDGANFNIDVWKNGIATPLNLTNTISVDVNSMYVSGDDVYVGGSEYIGTKHIAKIWKNGVSTPLNEGARDGSIASVFVSGNDIYAGGFERIGDGKDIAKIWKNGVATSLSDNRSRLYSIFVNNTDVYAVGYEEINGKRIATFWKNGVATSFNEDGKFISFTAVYVSNNNVYITGGIFVPGLSVTPDLNLAKVWVNGIKTPLETTYLPQTYSVFVLGDDVYVSGSEYVQGTEKTITRLWKNGIGTSLTDGVDRAEGYSVFATETDVYVGGYERNGEKIVAKIWKNGDPIILTDGTKNGSVEAVFVTEN